MKANISVSIQLDENDELPPEAIAVQRLQDELAALARLPVADLAEIWRQAVQKLANSQKGLCQRRRCRRK